MANYHLILSDGETIRLARRQARRMIWRAERCDHALGTRFYLLRSGATVLVDRCSCPGACCN